MSGLLRWALPGPADQARLVAADCVVSVALALFQCGVLVAAAPHHGGVPVGVGCALLAATALPLAVRRRWPLPVFTVVATLSLFDAALGLLRGPFLEAAYALYPVALIRARSLWPAVSVVALGGLLTVGGGSGKGASAGLLDQVGQILTGVLVMGAVWAIGRGVRERRAYVRRTAERLAADAVTEERLRIARDLHDVVAHSMSLIAVKAGVANYVMATRPEEAQHALRVIETTSRGALAELHTMLGLLRSETSEQEKVLAPAGGLGSLQDLVDQARAGGVEVSLEIGEIMGVPEGVGRSAYRIVQEALTNVLRHAGATRCLVRVGAGAEGLEIEVVDEGGEARPGRAGGREDGHQPGRGDGHEHGRGDGRGDERRGGHGLLGMRERAAIHGGRVEAGPRDGGGFVVRALLPLRTVPGEIG